MTKRAAERFFRYAAGRFFFPFVFPFFLFINVCIREQRVVTLDTGVVGDCGLGSILTFVTAARGGRLLYTNLGVYNRTRARVCDVCSLWMHYTGWGTNLIELVLIIQGIEWNYIGNGCSIELKYQGDFIKNCSTRCRWKYFFLFNVSIYNRVY